MGWESEMPRILRFLINDVDDPQTYSDPRLQEVLLVAAQYLVGEIDYFSNQYLIDVTQLSLAPDPTSGNRDNSFINLTILRANVIVTDALFRQNAAKAGFSIKDGPSSVDTRGILQGYKIIMEKAQKDYETARWEFQAGVAEPGRAILAPFSSPTLDFRGARYYDPRDREWL